MLLACQLLCESAEQQAQRFITAAGKEKEFFFSFCKEKHSWKILIRGDNWRIRSDTLGLYSTSYFENRGGVLSAL